LFCLQKEREEGGGRELEKEEVSLLLIDMVDESPLYNNIFPTQSATEVAT